ncbi:MAG: T9SS type A sorting domain-containing protein [Ignavibacteriaceae bacterium]|nr:T9SS type A sorting domain-containing protein [Ignavibacteriaceae bacterium]
MYLKYKTHVLLLSILVIAFAPLIFGQQANIIGKLEIDEKGNAKVSNLEVGDQKRQINDSKQLFKSLTEKEFNAKNQEEWQRTLRSRKLSETGSSVSEESLIAQWFEEQKQPFLTSQNQLFAIGDVTWVRAFGETEFYLTPTVKDIRAYNSHIRSANSKEKGINKSKFSVIRVEISQFSKQTLKEVQIYVPHYVNGSILVSLPTIDIEFLEKKNIKFSEVSNYAKILGEPSKRYNPEATIWFEGWEGSLSPYARGDANSSSGLDYWGDVNCDKKSGNWSLWCAGEGDQVDCINYDDYMANYVANISGINVQGYSNVQFKFWTKYITEECCDDLRFFASSDGNNYSLIATYAGSSGGWVQKTFTLTGYSNYFWEMDFNSDGSVVALGAYLDDMEITGDVASQPNYTVDPTGCSLSISGTNISATVKHINNGSASGGTNSYTDFFASIDQNISASDFLLGWLSVPSISSGGNYIATFNKDLTTVTPTIPAGTYYIGFIIDATANISESNENDNIFYWSTPTVTVGGDGNDVPTSATAISSIPHTGNYEINPEGDIDWYRVNLTANTQYTFANSSSTNFDSEFYLYGPGNSTGSTIGAQVAYDDDGGGMLQPLIVYTPTTAGYYYLRVADYSNNPTATRVKETKTENTLATGPYTLSITAQTSQPILSVTPDNRGVTSASGTTTFTIQNTGTGTMPWSAAITVNPSTMITSISPTSGSLTAGQSATLTVNYAQNTGTQQRVGTIRVTATGATGSPKDVTVTQAAHSGHGWVVTPNLQFNMSIIAQLYFTNVLTTNTADAIGAFVGTECRGIANPQGTNGLLFLTVGSNLSSGETITFKAWKSSTNEIQPIAQTIPFQNMGEIGTLTSPFRMDAGMRTQIISFGQGYTWFSVNVNPGNMSLNSLFVPPQLNPASNDRVIGQTQFSSWSGSSWVGSLTTINPVQGYVMKLSTAQVCTLQGQPVEIISLPIAGGYTWIGYLPQNSLPVNTALAGITPAPVANDRIISQTQFATWSGSSWIGSLTTMEPSKGYVIKLTNASTLVYPSTAAKIDSAEHKLLDSPNWVPVPNLQFNMSVIAKVQIDASLYSTNPNDLLGAFVGTECRGVATPIAPDGFYFLTVGSNLSSGETVTFKYYSSQYNLIKELGETVPFQNMGEIGTLSNPYILNAVPIPVEFVSFSAKQIGKDINIAWTTATETNNKEFEVERRLNGSSTWMKIGEVEGGGTTTSIREYSFIDKAIKESGLFNYRLKQIDFDGSYEYSNEIEISVDLVPTEFSLSQNYPNPFNPSTKISYAIPATANVTLKVFDVVGNEVATLVNESKEPGNYEVTFEAGNLSNGVYFYELKANEFRVVKKLVLMK